MGVKLRHAVAAAPCGRMVTAMNKGRRAPSQAPAANRCSVSDAISSMPAAPPIAPACPTIGCTASAVPARISAVARPMHRVSGATRRISSKAQRNENHWP